MRMPQAVGSAGLVVGAGALLCVVGCAAPMLAVGGALASSVATLAWYAEKGRNGAGHRRVGDGVVLFVVRSRRPRNARSAGGCSAGSCGPDLRLRQDDAGVGAVITARAAAIVLALILRPAEAWLSTVSTFDAGAVAWVGQQLVAGAIAAALVHVALLVWPNLLPVPDPASPTRWSWRTCCGLPWLGG